MASETYVFGGGEAPLPSAREGLPACFEVREDGLYVDPAKVNPALFQKEIEQFFAAGHVFRGLDYPVFQKLLFELETLSGQTDLKFAREVGEFPAERVAFYHNVKMLDGNAEYCFEPLQVDKEVDGQPVTEKVELDIDEFVAHLWQKNIRFGIDINKVVAAIHSPAVERVLVACERAALPGKDAGVEEKNPDLHRSNAPRVLPDGRADLSQYSNRFPQVRQGSLLLLKTPPQDGVPGRTVDGRTILPDAPKNFDLAALAGEGTKVERQGDDEVLIATIDGFLGVDTQTNQLSVNEKIINREGVNARTTGNLVLQGDEYEEYGEVQEGRSVEGKHLTFHADVFGQVMSTGGRIVLEKNLAGGSALNRDGSIVVKGRASGALIQLGRGTVSVKRAENSVIIADRIEVEQAIGCTLLGEEVVVQHSEGSAIAGKRIEIKVAKARGGDETLVSMLLPDLSAFDTRQAEEEAYISQCETLMASLKEGLDVISALPEFQQYIATAAKLHRKELVLNAQQEAQWHHFKARIAPTLKKANQAREDMKALEGEIAVSRESIASTLQERTEAGLGFSCKVETVEGETRVRTYIRPLDAPMLTRLGPKELSAALHGPAPGEQRLFFGESGDFFWESAPSN